MAYGLPQVQQFDIRGAIADQEAQREIQQIRQQDQQLRALTLREAMERRQAQQQAAQAEADEEQWLKQAASQFKHDNGRPDLQAIGDAYIQRNPEKGAAWVTKIQQGQKAAIDIDRIKADLERDDAAQTSRLLRVANPLTYKDIRQRLVARDPEADKRLPPEFDQPTLEAIAQEAEAYAGIQADKSKALQFAMDGKLDDWFASAASLTRSQAELDELYDDASAMLDAPTLRVLKGRYGVQWTPEFGARAAQVATSPEQRALAESRKADDERQKLAAAETVRSNQANERLRARDIALGEATLQQRKTEGNKPAAAGKTGPDVAAILTEIDGLSQKINTGAGGADAILSGYLRRGSSKAQLDNDVSQYEALISGMIPMVARAVGHTGVLTQQDVDSVRAMFPKVTDNAELAKRKMGTIKKLISGSGSPASSEKKLTAEELIKKYGGG